MNAILSTSNKVTEPYECTGSLSDIINDEASELISLSECNYVDVEALSDINPRTLRVSLEAGALRVRILNGLCV